MRSLKLALGTSAFVAASVVTAYAGPKAPVVEHGAPKTAATTHGHPHTAPTTTTPTHGTKTTTTTTSSTHKPTKTATASTTGTTTTSGTTTHTTTLNPIARKISSHPQLASKIEAMLPAGMTLNQASRGFKNQGQFIAALHASQNLGIPFTQLRHEMVTEHESLGQAIHELRPGTNSTTAARRAEHDADGDLHTAAPKPPATSTPTTPSTTTTTPTPSTTTHK